MNQEQILRIIPEIEYDELVNVLNITRDMSEAQQQQFIMLYQRRRKNKQELLLLCLLGFVGFAGIHRFVVGEVAMGVIYFFTAGLCFVGTVLDVININSFTQKYNQKQAYEVASMVATVFNNPQQF